MIYLEFKTRDSMGFKKIHYAKVLALLIKEVIQLKRVIKQDYPEIEFDYKIIFK